jgi:hypothetical protein
MTVLEMRNCICNCLLLLVPEINFLLRFFYNRRAINNLLSILYSSNSFNCSFKVNFIPILWNCSTRKFKFLLFVTTMLKDVMYSIVIKPYTITFAIFKVCNFCIKKLIIYGRCACLIVNSFSCSLIKSIAIRGLVTNVISVNRCFTNLQSSFMIIIIYLINIYKIVLGSLKRYSHRSYSLFISNQHLCKNHFVAP